MRGRREQGLCRLHDQQLQDGLRARRPYDQVPRLLQLEVRDLLDHPGEVVDLWWQRGDAKEIGLGNAANGVYVLKDDVGSLSCPVYAFLTETNKILRPVFGTF